MLITQRINESLRGVFDSGVALESLVNWMNIRDEIIS